MDKTLFVSGVVDQYPEALLENRLAIEGNMVGALLSDLTLYDDCGLDTDAFVTKDGRLLFGVGNELRSRGFNTFDEVTMVSNLPPKVMEKVNQQIGNFDQIQHLIDIISVKNYDSILDNLNKSNVILSLYKKGFNVTERITLDNDKTVVPYKFFDKLTCAQVVEWYESQISSLGTKISSSKIVEDSFVEFDDAFIDSLMDQDELGVDFGNAGTDCLGEEIHTFESLSRQIMGLKHGTLSAFAAASGVGKSTWLVGLLMSLIANGEHKVCLVSNESTAKEIKVLFLAWFCSRYMQEWKITKTKLISGNLTDEEKDVIQRAKKVFKAKFGRAIRIVTLADADSHLTCQILKNAILRDGVDIICVDTFKLTMNNNADNFWLSLVADTRALAELCLRYNVIGLMTVQLAINSMNRAWLNADCLSQSKAIKEVLSNLILMRQVVPTLEFDPSSSYYIKPFRTKQDSDGKWKEEDYTPDVTKTWRIIFVNKARRGVTSDDNGVCYLSRFDPEHASFYETAKCRPSHKLFNNDSNR